MIGVYRYSWISYVEVLKPRETGLLTVIGACTAFIAIYPDIQIIKFIVAILAIGIGSAGCNGLTNYLDRTVDGRMERTRRRALPQHLIDPPQKVLPMVLSLIMISLIMAWYLNPWCFIIGVIGVAASSLWRKTITCTIFGIIAGCCPILIGWLSANPVITAEIILITVLVAIWIPIHIWSVMVSKQHEYRNAGLNYFPLNLHLKITVRIMFVLGSILVAVSMLLYAMAFFHVVYFAVALVLGIVLLVSLLYLMIKTSSSIAWLVYKFSSFPYLGIIFAAMVVDKVTG